MDREEIITKVQNNTGVDMDEVTTLVHNWIDYIQEDICSRYDWSWLKGYAYITTEAQYSTGTVGVTNGSTTVSGTDTVWTSSMAGWFMSLPDGNYYEVESATTTSITLKHAYAGDTSTGEDYSIVKTKYALASDFKKMRWMTRVEPSSYKLVAVPEMAYVSFQPNPFQQTGEVKYYQFTGRNSDGNVLVQFQPIQTSAKMLYYGYIKELPAIDSEGAESAMPEKMHQLFVFKLTEIIFSRVDLDAKSKDFKMFYEEALGKFVKDDMEMSLDQTDIYANERIAKGYPTLTGKLDPDHYPIN